MTAFKCLLIAFNLSILAASTCIAEENSASEYHEQGRIIYNYRCYFCHGYSGDARTLTTTYVNPKPRDFTRTPVSELPREQMIHAVIHGKPQTAMHGFSRLLNQKETEAVVDFVRLEFMQNKKENTRYHTLENGWDNHQRYTIAFPFASGKIALDTPWESLTTEQVRGKQLFLTSCVTCHDRAIVKDEGVMWKKQAISYPRNNYSHTEIDAISSASIYAKHDLVPDASNFSAEARVGQHLWEENCAFCHGSDGTGENWIGSFLDPQPRNLSDPDFMNMMNRELLTVRIKNGLKNTSMPAWKNVLSEQQIQQIITYISEAFYPVAETKH